MSFKQHPKSDFADDTLASRFNTTATTSEHLHQRSHKMPEHTKDEAGVIEAYPGIIESTDIDPLHHESNKDNKSSRSCMAAAGDVAASAVQYVYSSATGDEAGKKAGKEGLWGSSK